MSYTRRNIDGDYEKEGRTSRTIRAAAEQALIGRAVTTQLFQSLKKKKLLIYGSSSRGLPFSLYYDIRRTMSSIDLEEYGSNKIRLVGFMGWLGFTDKGELVHIDQRLPFEEELFKAKGMWKRGPIRGYRLEAAKKAGSVYRSCATASR